MDVANINAFTEVIVNTFETSCNAKPFRYDNFKRVEGDLVNNHDLMGVIKFSGTLSGAIVMNFPADTANKLYGAMMMEDISEFNEEVAEGFAEILNMIIGNVKANLSSQKLEFEKPECFIGDGQMCEKQGEAPWLWIPMAFANEGKFDLYLSVRESS